MDMIRDYLAREAQAHNNAVDQFDEIQTHHKFYPAALTRSPEEDLVLACFEQGIAYAQNGGTDDLKWVKSKSYGPFSFAFCCDTLGLDHDATRKAVLAGVNSNPIPKGPRKFRRPDYQPVLVEDEMDRYDHRYIYQKHCNGCAARYHRAWQRARFGRAA